MWIQLVIMIVAALISYATRPKIKPPPAATLNDVQIPTIDQGTAVPVVFGEVWVDNWMVLWYGDLSNQPIKQKGGKK